jgi:nucleoside-diphosphate-sugar epimerase
MGKPSKKKVFITGIDGFSGSHLESFLSQKGFEVWGSTYSSSTSSNHYQCDILDKAGIQEVLMKVRPEYVIHLAAISFTAESNLNRIYDTNIIGSYNLLEGLLQFRTNLEKVILASSAAVYGNIGSTLSEDLCPNPANHYGNSKLAMENIARMYFDRMPIIVARPFNYTGPGQETHFLVPKIISHFSQRKPFIELGNLNTFREYNDISVILQMYLGLMLSDFYSGVVNLSTGKTYSIKDIISSLEQFTGHEIEVRINQRFVRKNEIKELKGSPSKLKEILGKLPDSVTLDQMLNKMYNRAIETL